MKLKLLFILMICVSVYPVFYAQNSTCIQNESIRPNVSQKLNAYKLGTDVVLNILLEPKTALFPGNKERLEHIISCGNGKFIINSWVDSQDTYGAMTRRKFRLTFQLKNSGILKEDFEIEKIGKILR